jgi:hypothetical protein
VDRRALVGAVQQALRARRRRRAAARWWAAGGVVAVAAAAAFVLAPRLDWRRDRGSSVSTTRIDARRFTVVATGAALDAGSAIGAPAQRELRIGTAEGTALVLEPGSGVVVLESGATQRLALKNGAVRVHVATLAAGQRFIIDTEDTEVEVHGTTFRIALGEADSRCPAPLRTRVSVSEGIVSVANGGRVTRLAPRADWPGPCPAAAVEPAASPTVDSRATEAPALDAPTAGAPTADAPTGDARRPPRRSSLVPASRASAPSARASGRKGAAAADDEAPAAPSVLAAQNDLFAAAVRARRRGEAPEALRLFNTFIQRYPRSQLYEHALAQKMKLLGATDPWGASEAASEYLERFPGGFARGEARALLNETGQP